MTIASGPGTFASGCTTSVAAVNGVANFSNLILNTAGAYTLSVSDGSLTGSTTATITVGPGAASQLVVTQAPATGTASQALGTAARSPLKARWQRHQLQRLDGLRGCYERPRHTTPASSTETSLAAASWRCQLQ